MSLPETPEPPEKVKLKTKSLLVAKVFDGVGIKPTYTDNHRWHDAELVLKDEPTEDEVLLLEAVEKDPTKAKQSDNSIEKLKASDPDYKIKEPKLPTPGDVTIDDPLRPKPKP